MGFFTAAVLSAHLSLSASVFLNGVNIDGVTNQLFQNCTVTIDAQGNVLIVAKGYAPPGTPAAVAPTPVAPAVVAMPTVITQHYWLVTEKAAPGMSQYDIELFVNSKFVRKFLDDEEHVVMEITKHLSPGNNTIALIAKKSTAAVRRSSSPQHYFRLVIGEGESSGRNVMIQRKQIDYKRTALETKDFKDEYTLVAR